MERKILVALDRTDMADRVLQEAIALAKATDGQLMLAHVLSAEDEGAPPPLVGASNGLDYYWATPELYEAHRQQWKEYETSSEEQMRSRALLAEKEGLETEFTQQSGSPGRAICDLARTWDADVIVVGRRGRKGLSEFLLGSVSNYVTHHAPCAVLLIPLQANLAQDPLPAEEAELSSTVCDSSV